LSSRAGGPAEGARYAIGIDLGGTSIKAASVSEAGEVLGRADAETQDGASPGAWTSTIRSLCTRLQSARGGPAAAIGVGAPGLAAADGRSTTYMRGSLAGLHGLDWPAALETSVPVRVLNDAHAALFGEAWRGAAAGCRDVVLLTLGTGVGGAILSEGRLVTGATGKAGHWGHITLDTDGPRSITRMPGSLEGAIGNCTIEARTRGRFLDTRALVAAHLAGDADATRVWLRSLYRLACAIASISNAVDPEVVILGGGIARAGPALFDPLHAFLEDLEWRPLGRGARVVPAALGELAGAIGAARAARGTAEPAGGPAARYLQEARGLIDAVAAQDAAVQRAADWFAATILAGRMVHVFGAGHSRVMVEEMWPRYGSFPGFNPIVELSLTFHNLVVGANGQRQAMFLENVPGLAARILRNFHLRPADSALVISSSGGSVVAVEMAEEFRRHGVRVVAMVSRRHAEATPSRDPRGRRLQDVADLVLDTGAPAGDALVRVEGLDTPVSPGSTVGGCLLVNAVKAEVAARLAAAGHPPTVLTAPALVGPDRSAALFEAAYDEHARRLARLLAGEGDDR
jgi:predicted NBD/HSP70 family sugar kinase/uncharacterized phosphosugar-binding protein